MGGLLFSWPFVVAAFIPIPASGVCKPGPGFAVAHILGPHSEFSIQHSASTIFCSLHTEGKLTHDESRLLAQKPTSWRRRHRIRARASITPPAPKRSQGWK